MHSPLLVIGGPTASGKSALAMYIAKKYNGEIICADSRTIYKGMDIGTAKPTLQDQQEVPHHLLDVVTPDQTFTAADFKRLALVAIKDIAKRGKLSIVVGGTGLYIDALIFDYTFGEPANPDRRTKLQAMSVADLQQFCLENAVPLPENTKNKRHLVRAIELGGVFVQQKRMRPNTLVVALTTDKDNLRGRITARAQQMVQQGVLDEVRRLGAQFGWEREALTGNIYRTLKPVVEDAVPLEAALELVIASDMQLAKRQITWLKRNPYVVWGTADQLKLVIEHFVQQNILNQSIPDAL